MPSHRKAVPEGGSMDCGQDTWRRIIGLSHEMLARARNGKWREVTGLEAERIDLIRHFFSASRSQEQLEHIRPLADRLKALDKEIEDLCKQAQGGLVKDLKSLRRGRTAARAYKAPGRD